MRESLRNLVSTAVLLALLPAPSEASLLSARGGLDAKAFGFGRVLTASGCDPSYSSVATLMHMDGTNGGTSFVDNGPHALTVTPANFQTSSTQVKFGTASANATSTAGLLSFSSAAAFVIGTGNATIEFEWFPNGTNTDLVGSEAGTAGANDFVIWASSTNQIALFGASTFFVESSTTASSGSWHAIAFVKQSNVWHAYIDGTEVSYAMHANDSRTLTATAPSVGHTNATDGWNSISTGTFIDEYRWTTGVARYTTNYVPATAAFPNC